MSAATGSAAKPKKRASGVKKVAAHPTYLSMVKKAIAALKERNGSSRQHILAYVMANFNVGHDARSVNSRVKTALRRGVTTSALKQTKGTGASGSFKIAEKAPKATKAKKAKTPKKAKTTATKVKKSPKKKSSPKKKAAKKTPTKKAAGPKKTKSPKKKSAKKAKKPAKK